GAHRAGHPRRARSRLGPARAGRRRQRRRRRTGGGSRRGARAELRAGGGGACHHRGARPDEWPTPRGACLIEAIQQPGAELVGPAGPVVWTRLKIVAIIAPLMLAVAYLTLAERKVIGYMQVRIGPNRVGPAGLLQPIADGLKLMF